MLDRMRKSLREKDGGFTLIELLVVVIIIGILAGIAIPIFLNQKQKGYDASVKSDLKNYAGTAETYFVDAGDYGSTATPTDDAFKASGATSPIASKGNSYKAFLSTTAGQPGYVIYGTNTNSNKVFVITSFNGTRPGDTAVTSLASATAATAATDAAANDGPTVTFAATAITW